MARFADSVDLPTPPLPDATTRMRSGRRSAVMAIRTSLTPGTVSADVSEDRRTLLIHALDVDDQDAMIRQIKQRYERPLKEIFEC